MSDTLTISGAKIKVLNKSPFFGSLLMQLPVVESEELSTLGVDGTTLFVNPKYWDTLSRPQKYAALIHECGHLFLNHIWRGRNYTDVAVDPASGAMISLFNLAGDAVINDMIKADARYELGQGWFWDAKYSGWATEEVYNDLKKNMKQATPQQMKQFMDKAAQNSAHGCDKSKWDKGTPKERKEAEAKWKEHTKQAAEFARDRGENPAWMKRLYEDLQPKEDWRNILREYIQPFANDYSFSPADRRYLDSGFVLPDIQDGEKLDWVAVAIDTSGSIGNKELDAFLGEVKGILGAYDQVKAKLTFCDAAATPFVDLMDWDTDKNKIKVAGGGGTDFVPVFKLIEKEDTAPLCLLYFTDLQGSFPKKAPDYDTLWVNIENGEVPFGKKYRYKI